MMPASTAGRADGLKRDTRDRDIPVVIFTAREHSRGHQKSSETGAATTSGSSNTVPVEEEEPDRQLPRGRHTAWMVDSLETLRTHLERLGVPYREQKGRVGADQVFIVDPDGHTWEFQEPSALYPE